MKDPVSGAVRESDKIPFWQKVAYGFGSPVNDLVVWIPKQNFIPVFNIGLGMNPAVLGVILMIWRGWDAFADLITGNISDHAQTRWGRRRPFIVAGAVLTGLATPLIWWMPRGMGDWPSTAWLLIGGLIFYTCYSVWAMPYFSLQLQMTPDYDERTNITAFRSFFQNLFSLVTGWILAAAALPMFSSLPGGKPDLANGMRYVSLLLAVVTIILGIVPGLFVKERLFLDAGKKQARQGILAGLKMTLSRRPFLWLIVIVLCNTFGFGVVSTVGFYLNAYYVCAGDIALATHIQGAKSTALFLPTLLAIPFFTWFSHRFDKKAVLYLVIGMAITGYLSVYLCYTPRHPWLQILPSFLIGPSNLGLVMILPAMQADIADYDELQTGQRREGSFSAVFSWAYKASVTMTVGLAGVLLVATGFNIKLGAAQHPDVLMHLKLCYIWLPISLTLVGVCAVYQYNLTRQKMMEIRQLLEFKRGAA